jgi:ribonuclease Z
VGDAGATRNLLETARGADALVIEATYLDRDSDMARRFGHLTARQAAELAHEAGVGHLFLVHISRRYSDREIMREAREVFPDTTVPRDLDQYTIARGAVARVQDT